jgi:hypothetical protein
MPLTGTGGTLHADAVPLTSRHASNAAASLACLPNRSLT